MNRVGLFFQNLRHDFGKILLIALGYFAVAQLGLLTKTSPAGPTPVWPPAGFGLAMLCLFGPRVWLGVNLGSLAMLISLKIPFWTIIGLNLANTFEPLLGVFLLRASGKTPEQLFNSFRGVLGFIGRGALPNMFFSATVGTATLFLTDFLPIEDVPVAWWEWWVSGVLSELVLTPLILVWHQHWRSLRQRIHPLKIEPLSCMVLLVLANLFTFFPKEPKPYVSASFEYVIFVLLIYCSVRWGLRAASVAAFLTSTIGVIGTSMGKGPFVLGSVRENFILLQLFVAAISFIGLVLSASVAERVFALREAEKAIRIRDEFLLIASHELNTPLTSLKMQAQLLNGLVKSGKIHAYPKEKLAELTRISERQIARFAELVDSLLDVSRMSAGRLDLEPEKDVDLSEIVRSVVERYQAELKRSNCSVALDLDSDLAGKWDRSRIDQVVANLLTNSVKYNPEGFIKIRTQKAGMCARLIVKDHGVGIAPEDLRRIFDRFERGAVPANQGGLGLGLYISREIVKAHGGAIGVESSPGEGATFVVELPLDERISAEVS